MIVIQSANVFDRREWSLRHEPKIERESISKLDQRKSFKPLRIEWASLLSFKPAIFFYMEQLLKSIYKTNPFTKDPSNWILLIELPTKKIAPISNRINDTVGGMLPSIVAKLVLRFSATKLIHNYKRDPQETNDSGKRTY